MSDSDETEFPIWRTPEGEPVSCIEKIKVLNENLAELRELAQESLEDAVLMGCDEQGARGARRDCCRDRQPVPKGAASG
jgi:hypothetical protein